MLCCLCLKDSENVTKIFEGREALRGYNIANVVSKHFCWFEPFKENSGFNAICKMCWGKLYDFHVFYEMVENVHLNHRPEMEVMTVKTEAVGLDSLPDQALDEVPFSTDLISTKQTEANYNSDHSEYDNEFDMGELQPFKEEESEHSDPFEIVTTSPKRNTSEPIEKTDENIRLTRYQRKSMVDIKEGDESSVEIKVIKRGRKRKEKETTDSEMPEIKPKKAGCKDKANKNSEEESAYKCKMKSFDNEISQYMGLHCDVCNVAVDNFAGLKTHMRSEHNIDNGYVKCCDKKFHKRANLLYHIRKHVDPNCYRCEECDQTFSDYQSLRNHFNVKHQKEEDKIYTCTDCPKKFARKYLLEQHKTFKHKDRCKQCKMCNRRYKTLEELEEHNKEPCAAGIMCDICAKVIFGPGAFKRHQLDHDGGQALRVQCDMCGSWHRDKYALRKHKRRHLEPKTPHVCDICHKVSPSREAMESHKKYAHRSERTFECEFCHKCFKRPISLREHLTTHTGAVLYTCPHCPKTFNSNANMHSHRKNVHPVEFEEARKRRHRIGYLGDKTTVKQLSEPLLNSHKNDSELRSDSSHKEGNEPIIVTNDK